MVNRSHLSVVPDAPKSPDEALTIDCEVCVAQHTSTCRDCVVTYVVGRELGQPISFSGGDARAIQLLADAGLVPESRFERNMPVA